MAPVVVQRIMGHTDIQVTLNTYTSVFDEFKEKEIEKVNKYFIKKKMLSDNTKLLDEYEIEEDIDDGIKSDTEYEIEWEKAC